VSHILTLEFAGSAREVLKFAGGPARCASALPKKLVPRLNQQGGIDSGHALEGPQSILRRA